jgi:histidyl-tRNA synthetase
MKKVEPRTLSGFMELLPSDQLKFNKIKNTIEETYQQFGFLPLDTPIIEASEVLLAKAGGETEKQIYQIKRGNSDLTLRFDLTVPLAKYVAKNYGQLNFPFRRYQIGKVYRGERAQKGRYREFYQCDIDIIGDGSLNIINDAEIPNIIYNLFNNMGLTNFVIKINNRKVLNGFLQALNLTNQSSDIMRLIDKKDKISKESLINELENLNIDPNIINKLLTFININGTNNEIINQLQTLDINNELWQEGIAELETVYQYSIQFGIKENNIQIDLGIARGLDYYTGTVYETFLTDYLELGSICSGGRYDDLAEYYTDKKLPGVGISIGLTRLFTNLNELNLLKEEPINVSDVLIIPMTNNYEYIINCYNKLMENNIYTQIFYEQRSIKSIINYAINLNIPYVIFIGDDEIKNKTVTIKNIKTFEQKTMDINNIIKEVHNEQRNI